MKQIIFLVLILYPFQGLFAQLEHLGLRAEFATILSNSSESATVNKPLSIGLGLAGHYAASPTWETTVGAMVSSYQLSGDTRDYNAGTQLWEKNAAINIRVVSLQFDYTILHGFDEAQHFKLGLGAWLSVLGVFKSTFRTQTPMWGNASAYDENYQLRYLYERPINYGLLAEGLYNVNDALQFSLRFKFGLRNLYNVYDKNAADNPLKWRENSLGINVMYYLGGEKRGSTKSSKSKSKKKIDF